MRYSNRETYTPAEYAAAKQANIIAFLQSSGYELTRAGTCYKGKIHDSLVIRDDGRWYWNKHGLHGSSPIELYKHILLQDYGYTNEITAAIAAIKQLANGYGAANSSDKNASSINRNSSVNRASNVVAPPLRADDEPLLLPAPLRNNNRVMAYLCQSRRLDPDIVRELIQQRKIYETVQAWNKEQQRYIDTPYHNTVFVAYDTRARPQSAFLRGTLTYSDKSFKKDVDFSNKSYPFTLSGSPQSDRVFCFESAIDAISHASLCKQNGSDWRCVHRIALGGTSFLGLERHLFENPRVISVVSCLDNDETGNRRSEKMLAEYRIKGYDVEREAPQRKDYNEDLLAYGQADTVMDEEDSDEMEP